MDYILFFSWLQEDVMGFYIALSLCHTVQASLEKNPQSFYKYHYQVIKSKIMIFF